MVAVNLRERDDMLVTLMDLLFPVMWLHVSEISVSIFRFNLNPSLNLPRLLSLP
jgi:hypothetical protein